MSEYYKIKKENFDKMYKSATERKVSEHVIVDMFDRGYKSALENMTYLFENEEEKEIIKPTIQDDEFNKFPTYVKEITLFDKLMEEIKEFNESLPSERENMLEEAFDVIQMVYNILDVRGFEKQEIQEAIKIHNEKLRLRGWKFKGEEK